jgi:hypothetical protein
MNYLINKNPPRKVFKQLIDYAAFLENEKCDCKPEIYKKQSCQQYSAYNSRYLRIAGAINTYTGGRIQFGNYYLIPSRRPGLNYLGRSEGMPGGSGAPIKNKF